jgi:sigma-54 interacting transcriptional regulator
MPQPDATARRAFHFTHEYILGGSAPAVRLRASVWQAIFTRDMRRYTRSLYQRMHDVPTLIVGPSGTGKELVARAIGHSRFIPFDPARERFVEDFRGAFYALNLAALPSTLIESEPGLGETQGLLAIVRDEHGARRERAALGPRAAPPGRHRSSGSGFRAATGWERWSGLGAREHQAIPRRSRSPRSAYRERGLPDPFDELRMRGIQPVAAAKRQPGPGVAQQLQISAEQPPPLRAVQAEGGVCGEINPGPDADFQGA